MYNWHLEKCKNKTGKADSRNWSTWEQPRDTIQRKAKWGNSSGHEEKTARDNIMWKWMYDKSQLMWNKVNKRLDENNVCELGKQWKVENEKIYLTQNGNSHTIV